MLCWYAYRMCVHAQWVTSTLMTLQYETFSSILFTQTTLLLPVKTAAYVYVFSTHKQQHLCPQNVDMSSVT